VFVSPNSLIASFSPISFILFSLGLGSFINFSNVLKTFFKPLSLINLEESLNNKTIWFLRN